MFSPQLHALIDQGRVRPEVNEQSGRIIAFHTIHRGGPGIRRVHPDTARIKPQPGTAIGNATTGREGARHRMDATRTEKRTLAQLPNGDQVPTHHGSRYTKPPLATRRARRRRANRAARAARRTNRG